MNQYNIGTKLPELTVKPINRTTLALYAGASGDHNPIHIDIDFAQKAGMEDVFAHGMLSMAYLGRFLTNWQPQSKLRHFSNKFTAITKLNDQITCSGEVVEQLAYNGEQCLKLAIKACKQDGTPTLVGEAFVAV